MVHGVVVVAVVVVVVVMGACRHGQGGTCLPLPRKCCKLFFALVVTVNRSVDNYICIIFTIFGGLECFKKGRQLF